MFGFAAESLSQAGSVDGKGTSSGLLYWVEGIHTTGYFEPIDEPSLLLSAWQIPM